MLSELSNNVPESPNSSGQSKVLGVRHYPHSSTLDYSDNHSSVIRPLCGVIVHRALDDTALRSVRLSMGPVGN